MSDFSEGSIRVLVHVAMAGYMCTVVDLLLVFETDRDVLAFRINDTFPVQSCSVMDARTTKTVSVQVRIMVYDMNLATGSIAPWDRYFGLGKFGRQEPSGAASLRLPSEEVYRSLRD